MPTGRRHLCSSVLDNTGSVARDLLAAERTFLAWARTGLGFLGAGTGLFSAYATTAHEDAAATTRANRILPACGALWLNGAGTLLFAMARYHSVAEHLKHGKFPLGGGGLASIIVSTMATSMFALGVIVRDEVLAQEEAKSQSKAK